MKNFTHENEAIKAEYFSYVRGGEGCSIKSIYKYARSIALWQDFTENDTFANFTSDLAERFKEYLKVLAEENKTSLSSQYDHLRYLGKFFRWLCEQKGYEKIRRTDIIYLRLPRNESRAARARKATVPPTIGEIRALISSIPENTEVDKRDKALICLLALTGIRVSAVSSLPIKSFNRGTLVFEQNPNIGVKTKNSKYILTTFLPINLNGAEECFLSWFDYLIREKGFLPEDPIFPSSWGASNEEVSRAFWKTSHPAYNVVKKRFEEANLPSYSPHAFRHFTSACLSEMRLTKKEEKACSMNFGHEEVSTTFGSYGYGDMTPEKAVEIVKKTRRNPPNTFGLSADQREAIRKLSEIV